MPVSSRTRARIGVAHRLRGPGQPRGAGNGCWRGCTGTPASSGSEPNGSEPGHRADESLADRADPGEAERLPV